MKIPFRLVDVFTERPFAGNQLCVVPETPRGLGVDAMQMLAKEISFSETTFVTRAAGARYSMRIFTPDQEVPFAGHPTLGTAFVMVSEGRVESASVIQTVAAGDIPVEVDVEREYARMRQLRPEFRPEFEDRALAAEAAGLTEDDLDPGLPMQVVSTGLGPLLVPVRDEDTLRRASRREEACMRLAEAAGSLTLYYFAIRGNGDVTARMFDPEFGIGEDPATGSAAGPLGAYLAVRRLAGMPGRMTIAQGELVGRPSFLHVEASAEGASWAIHVGGGVRRVGEGSFEL
jgi:trans-2,3-dihydro-3-hydroxyanthranilate isomerase